MSRRPVQGRTRLSQEAEGRRAEQAGAVTVASTSKAKQDRAGRLRAGWFEQFQQGLV